MYCRGRRSISRKIKDSRYESTRQSCKVKKKRCKFKSEGKKVLFALLRLRADWSGWARGKIRSHRRIGTETRTVWRTLCCYRSRGFRKEHRVQPRGRSLLAGIAQGGGRAELGRKSIRRWEGVARDCTFVSAYCAALQVPDPLTAPNKARTSPGVYLSARQSTEHHPKRRNQWANSPSKKGKKGTKARCNLPYALPYSGDVHSFL